MSDHPLHVGTRVVELHTATEDNSVTPPRVYRKFGTVVNPTSQTGIRYDRTAGAAPIWDDHAAVESSWEHRANLTHEDPTTSGFDWSRAAARNLG